MYTCIALSSYCYILRCCTWRTRGGWTTSVGDSQSNVIDLCECVSFMRYIHPHTTHYILIDIVYTYCMKTKGSNLKPPSLWSCPSSSPRSRFDTNIPLSRSTLPNTTYTASSIRCGGGHRRCGDLFPRGRTSPATPRSRSPPMLLLKFWYQVSSKIICTIYIVYEYITFRWRYIILLNVDGPQRSHELIFIEEYIGQNQTIIKMAQCPIYICKADIKMYRIY